MRALCDSIKGAGAVIEDEDRVRLFTRALATARRCFCPPDSSLLFGQTALVITSWEAYDKTINLSRFGGLAHFTQRSLRISPADVVQNCA